MASYTSVKALYAELPAYQPLVSTTALPAIAFFFLTLSFLLTFFLTTLKTTSIPVTEVGTALAAAFLAGGGVVALFCTVGVYV
ncbi:hypothetical protein Q8F55_004971 [Vanrija albida]|uniref:Dolichyl-diphosphooligosaccharide-protein glycosyltransferase subunit OST5 n=1 Tax=Vanrija albida TaxID=181172 RepID=A0ABR3Q0T4_9TREE